MQTLLVFFNKKEQTINLMIYFNYYLYHQLFLLLQKSNLKILITKEVCNNIIIPGDDSRGNSTPQNSSTIISSLVEKTFYVVICGCNKLMFQRPPKVRTSYPQIPSEDKHLNYQLSPCLPNTHCLQMTMHICSEWSHLKNGSGIHWCNKKTENKKISYLHWFLLAYPSNLQQY